MADVPPIMFSWEGDCFRPASGVMQKRCDQHYVIGERYALVPHEARSQNSHRHLFAIINEAWQNLPERYALDFPSSEHLRKRLLIQAGLFNEVKSAWPTDAVAARVAKEIRATDEFSLVMADGRIVTRYEAKSMSMRNMDRKAFQEAKTKILEILDEMLGTRPGELESNAGKAA
jgi:hypothetical protein